MSICARNVIPNSDYVYTGCFLYLFSQYTIKYPPLCGGCGVKIKVFSQLILFLTSKIYTSKMNEYFICKKQTSVDTIFTNS